jgi:hypothetical protein
MLNKKEMSCLIGLITTMEMGHADQVVHKFGCNSAFILKCTIILFDHFQLLPEPGN